jgi:hypothetical protein
MAIARQTDGTSSVSWRTQPLPANADPAKARTFTWVAGLGYASEPPGKFTLYLGNQLLLELDTTLKSAFWRSADGKVTLKYTVKSANEQDSSGLMELTLPPDHLRPSEAAELRVVGSLAHSRRWFGLYELDRLSP